MRLRNWVLIAVATVPRVASSQSLPRITVGPANATLTDDFVALFSLRELADGRVLLTDGRAQEIYVADFSSGRATPVTRKGKGPLEFSFAGALHASAADSTIMNDLSNRRWLLFAGGKAVGTLPPDHPAVKNASTISGADRRGRVLAMYGADFPSGVRLYTRSDSQIVALVDTTV